MKDDREHSYIPKLKEQFAEGKIDRREFLRSATLLGLSAGAAYAFVGKVTGDSFVRPAKAAIPKGGNIRIGMRVQDVKQPHIFDWVQDSNVGRQVAEYLTKTDTDNVTRPYLLEKWEASDDLKTWTLSVRKGVKWHNGRDFTADDVVWNLKHVLDPEVGSSVIGLMKGYMLEEYDTGQKDDDGNAKMSVRLWDSNAIEKIDDHTVRMNAKAPQLAVPEHLFHYPLLIIDPEENGFFGPGSNGTGAFDLIEHEVGKKSILKARNDYWGDGPYLASVIYQDLGDDPAAAIGAIAAKQVDGLFEAGVIQLQALKNMPHVNVHEVTTAQTAVARMKINKKPFDNPLVRTAMRLGVDSEATLKLAHRGLGLPAEHHHVCPIHPEYAKLTPMGYKPEEAKKLLAEAGYPDGIDIEIACKKEPAWELLAVQAMVEQWKKANIRVNINVMPSAQYWEAWDVVDFGFTQWTHRPLGVMVLGLAYRTGVPWNETEYANPEFDSLLTQAEGILDVDERREVMDQIQRIMQEDGPIAQPLWRSVFTVMDKRVQGFQMHPTSYIFANTFGI